MTREAILDAARQRFAESGYEQTSIRAVAAEAGVNSALVMHFFGSKEALFRAARHMTDMLGKASVPASTSAGRLP